MENIKAFQLTNSEMDQIHGGGIWGTWKPVLSYEGEGTLEQWYNWFHLHGTTEFRPD